MIAECLVVEFRVTGDECPLADASRETGAAIDARPPLRRADGNTLLQFSTEDPAVGEVLDADERVRPLHQSRANGRYNYRCLSKHRCIVNDLVDVGFLVDSTHYDAGTERYVGAVVGRDVLKGVLEAAGETFGVKLERISPLDDSDDEPVAKRWDVTPAQEAAVRAAIESGYFEVPRAATAGEVAAELDISKSAFLERLRRAEESLLRQIVG
ncbi:helix-turn-helix domain-containing protein [Natronomonas salina]|uniref:helix-turn-helix domain-containing protein n=1 Tax=Natronomonas salina TaxID=1710540 RepID=UPI0015B51279|nr:helix-turn-helix domain-containing protein [Natronomonas salina]QLD88217.1 helix-turn-helix domain-containing protein [Natronomonas salina]